jgi:hypothetical protein
VRCPHRGEAGAAAGCAWTGLLEARTAHVAEHEAAAQKRVEEERRRRSVRVPSQSIA